jgi:hypothetical protein
MALPKEATSATRPPAIQEMKEEIRRRALERQARIERGEYDVPIRYTPLPVLELLDLLAQLEYRVPSLDLAVPPWKPSWPERLKRFLKKGVCTALRWLLIRQVEFNTIALQQGRESARLHALADQNLGEFKAALTALKLQMHALAERLTQLEGRPMRARSRVALRHQAAHGWTANGEAEGNEIRSISDAFPENTEEAGLAYPAYLNYFKGRCNVLVLGAQRGDFLKVLLSEGIPARGVDADAQFAQFCCERELPVECAELSTYLARQEDGALGGIYFDLSYSSFTPRELGPLLGGCWAKLQKGAAVMVATRNPVRGVYEEANGSQLPAELLTFLIESQSFSVVDCFFSDPVDPEQPSVRRGDEVFDSKQYRSCAVVGRK